MGYKTRRALDIIIHSLGYALLMLALGYSVYGLATSIILCFNQ